MEHSHTNTPPGGALQAPVRWQITAFEGYLSELPLLMALGGLLMALLFTAMLFSVGNRLVPMLLFGLALCLVFLSMGFGLALFGGMKRWECTLTDTGVEIAAWPCNPLNVYTWLGPAVGVLFGLCALLFLVLGYPLAALGNGLVGTAPFLPLRLKPDKQYIAFTALARVWFDPEKKALRFVPLEGVFRPGLLICPPEQFEDILRFVQQKLGGIPLEQGSIQPFRPMRSLWRTLGLVAEKAGFSCHGKS